jgi:hypothetical protein
VALGPPRMPVALRTAPPSARETARARKSGTG